MLVVLFVSLLLGVNAQTVWDGSFPRVQWFGDIAADDLFRAPANPQNPTSQWGGPLDAPQQKPQSYRTFSVCYNPLALGGPNFFAGAVNPNTPAVAAPDTLPAGAVNPAANERRMVISLVAPADLTVPVSGAQFPAGTGVNFEVKLEHPWLELDPWQCPSFAAGGRNPATNGNCRCNYNGIYDGVDRPQDRWNVRGNPMVINFPLGSRNASFDIPNWTYFEHAPVANQHPYMKTYRKLCMRPQQNPGQAVPDVWMDTTVWIAVVHCCQDPTINPANTNFQCTNTRFQTSLSYSWNKVTLPDSAIDAEWICNRAGFLGEFFDFARFPTTTLGPNTPQPVNFGAASGVGSIATDGSLCWGETTAMTLARWQRTQCCGARPALATGDLTGIFGFYQENSANAIPGEVAQNEVRAYKFGRCYNPQVESCCGWKTYNGKGEKCCSKLYARINYVDQPCKCTSTNEQRDCQTNGQNLPRSVAVTLGGNAADLRGATDPLDTDAKCCVNTKYPELQTSIRTGFCYDTRPVIPSAENLTPNDNRPISNNFRCCDDGNIYDIGASQCCPINGVQSLNIPCPCSSESHCSAGQSCCIQQWPRNWEDGQGPDSLGAGLSQCDRYANWPSGTGAADKQRCLGSCFDLRFQTCCNGAVCVREYERCCNSTCCNRFTSGCIEGHRAGTIGFGGRVNPNDYRVSFELCSDIEVFTTRRAFWVWVMPVFWTFATVISLAIVAVVARRACENRFDLTERAMVFFAIILVFLAIPHYFSPTYKYGVVLCFTGMIVIISAVMRSRNLSLVCIFLVFFLILYWVDPFEGNIYLSLTGGVSPVATDFAYASGIIEALFRLERNRAECTGFYDYFGRDPYLHDFERLANPAKRTFGFCTRAWMTTLLIFSIICLAAMLVLLLLAIFSFTKKIMPRSINDVEGFGY